MEILRLPSPIPSHDLFFISLHTAVDSLVIVENIILLLAIILRSPPSLRSYSVLLANIVVVDLIAATASLLTIVRLIPVGEMCAFLYDGPCVIISGFFCHCLFIATVATLSQSLFLIAFSFAYRLYALERSAPPSRLYVHVICLLISAYMLVTLIPLLLSTDNSDNVRSALSIAKPEYSMDDYIFEGFLSFYKLGVIWSISGIAIPSLPALVLVIVLRAKVLSIQAVLPVFFVFGVIDYLTCQFSLVTCTPVQEHIMMTAASFIPLLSPAITLYYVQPYRIFVENIFGKNRQKTSAIISLN